MEGETRLRRGGSSTEGETRLDAYIENDQNDRNGASTIKSRHLRTILLNIA